MSEKKNRSVTYIYKEMDPSEKVEFERDLQEDENLLIEVESFKRIQKRLGTIQSIDAPDELLQAICRQAAQKRQKTTKTFLFNGTFYGAAAALLLFGITSGFLLLNGEEAADSGALTNTASMSTPVFIYQSSPAVSAVTSSSDGKVTPWVDTNEVIYFHDRLRTSGAASVDSIFENSFRKLTPVKNPSFTNPNQRNLHLTGSRR
ncbi:MAG: hypothetical protein JJU37_10880 [Balneolaceae bacterium]|nr:hypothetical protein [Balneolaceae bacterium]